VQSIFSASPSLLQTSFSGINDSRPHKGMDIWPIALPNIQLLFAET
jgi:hypothetical protein